jgi:hypothetical protein
MVEVLVGQGIEQQSGDLDVAGLTQPRRARPLTASTSAK